jgi:hypothetical protein
VPRPSLLLQHFHQMREVDPAFIGFGDQGWGEGRGGVL